MKMKTILEQSISSYPYMPISASYFCDKNIDLAPYLQQYSNGYIFVSHPFLAVTKNTALNNKNAFYLTNRYKLDSILQETSKHIIPAYNGALAKIHSVDLRKFLKVTGINVNADEYNIDNATQFVVEDNGDGTLSFRYGELLYLKVNPLPPYKLTVGVLAGNYSKFYLTEYNENYVIQTKALSFPRFLLASSTAGYPVRAVGTHMADIRCQFGIIFATPVAGSTTLDGVNLDTNFIKYYNENDDSSHNKDVIINEAYNLSGISQNFLVDTPYETKIDTLTASGLKVTNVDVNLLPLKNIKTTNYNYAKLDHGNSPNNAVEHRLYDNIFAGTNQEVGYENLYLGYNAEDTTIVLYKDQTTYFHIPSSTIPNEYPIQTNQAVFPLSAAGLDTGGAIASYIPLYADKIWKMNANYDKYSYWGNSKNVIQNGTWLCAWLSGHIPDAVWMDRWYNPQKTTVLTALTSISYELNDEIIDVPSQLTIDEGVWYKYFHVGENFIDSSISAFSNSSSSMVLNFDNWNESVLDTSNYHNNGAVVRFTTDCVETQINDLKNENVLNLKNAGEFCIVPFGESINPTNKISYFMWVYADDWQNQNSSYYISNGIRNGLSLRYSNGFFNSYYMIFDKNNRYFNFYNLDNRTYLNSVSPLSTTEIKKMDLDSNLFVWGLDIVDNYIYKINYNGIVDAVLKIGSPIQDFIKDDHNNIWVLGTGMVSGYRDNLTPLTSYVLPSANLGDTLIDVDLSGNIITVYGDESCVDNNSNVWVISGGILYKNDVIVLSAASMQDVTCDLYNNMWVLYNNTRFAIIDPTGTVSLSAEIPAVLNQSGIRGIDFISRYEQGVDNHYAVIFQGPDKKIFQYDLNGELIDSSSIDFNVNGDYVLFGDFTGYQWFRKFRYVRSGKSNQILADFVVTDTQNNINLTTLSIPTSSLSKGWHHLGIMFNGYDGICELYVDALKVAEENTGFGSKIFYDRENSLYIGTAGGINGDLDTELATSDNFTMKIKIDDVRVYNTNISIYEIVYLYLSKFMMSDIEWSILTSPQYYIEGVQRTFRHKLPGAKSPFYNINIVNLGINNSELRLLIEDIIKETVKKLTPVYSALYKINWK